MFTDEYGPEIGQSGKWDISSQKNSSFSITPKMHNYKELCGVITVPIENAKSIEPP
jgi:hypothetical protein